MLLATKENINQVIYCSLLEGEDIRMFKSYESNPLEQNTNF
jgi:hypothetical protein